MNSTDRANRMSLLVDEKLIWPLEERERRYEQIRFLMAIRGIDCLLIYGREEGDQFLGQLANLSYVTNMFTSGFCLFPLEHDPIAFVGGQNKYDPYNFFAFTQNWIDIVYSQDSGIKGAGISGLIKNIKELGLEGSRIGLVDGNEKEASSLPYKVYQQITEALPKARFSNETSLLTEVRLRKSPWEICMLEKAGQIAKLMIRSLIETCSMGIRECDVFNSMLQTHIEAGGDPHVFIDLASGPVNSSSHLLHGKLPPYSPRQRRLEYGDIVMVELHAKYGGYLAAAEKTVVIGKAEPEFMQLHNVAVEALLAGKDALKVGVPFNVAVEAMRKPVLKRGFGYLELGLHQHGLSSAGFPTAVYPDACAKYLPLRNEKGNFCNVSSFKLREGMVFGQNVDIHIPWWHKNLGVMLGDTVVITAEGPRLLVDNSLELPIV